MAEFVASKRPAALTWLAPALLVAVSLALVLALAAGPLLALGIQRRMVAPPAFALRVGRYELVAPCPKNVICDVDTPFFGVWLGRERADGSMNYKSVFFMYRHPPQRR